MKLRKEKKLNQKQYENLYCSTAISPVFYALIKTHKDNYPIRPIVSFVDSPTYQVSKMLSKILTPLTNVSELKLKNSAKIKQELETINLN